MANSEKLTYFGNFAFQREYTQQIIFYTKNKIIFSPQRVFALPPNKDLIIIVKSNNTIKKIKVRKDDCIKNFFQLIFKSINNKRFSFFYSMILEEAKIRAAITNKS